MADIVAAYQTGGEGKIDFGEDVKASFGRFAGKDASIAVFVSSEYPNPREAAVLALRFWRDEPQPVVTCVGQYRMVVIVNSDNPVKVITLEQLSKLLSQSGKTITWNNFDGKGGIIKCYGETKESWSRRIINTKCLGIIDNETGWIRGYQTLRNDFFECSDAEEIVNKVQKDPAGIGFIPYTARRMKGVKTLEFQMDAVTIVAINSQPVIQNDYPLSEYILLYRHPKAPRDARELCEFAVGPDGSAIAEKHGLITPYMQVKAQVAERLKQMQAGLGQRLTGIGCDAARKVMPDLVTEFVKAKAVVQMSYLPYPSDAIAVGAFVVVTVTPGSASSQPTSAPVALAIASSAPASAPAAPVFSAFVAAGGKELLLLDDRMSDAAMRAAGEKWNTLGRDENGKLNGSGPTEYVPAGRAVAVIVNAANKAEALTLDQIKSIFSGEAGSWKMVGGAGVASGSGKINCFGLGVNDPSTVLFGKEALAVSKFKGVTIKKDAAEVIAAVSMDTDAIGFVDLTAIPTTGQTVKILAIQLGTGEKAKIIQPTAQNIKNSMYPLSSRIFLYVHPNASDTARDFAKFIATCGASESSPYADTVKSMMETYRKNGLIPLSDAAITRAAKDAMAAAKVKEADAATAKPK